MHWKSEGRYRCLRPKTARASLIFFFPLRSKVWTKFCDSDSEAKARRFCLFVCVYQLRLTEHPVGPEAVCAGLKTAAIDLKTRLPNCLPQKRPHSLTNTPASFTIRAAQKIKKIRCKPDKEGKKRARAGKRQKKKGKRERTRMYPHWM